MVKKERVVVDIELSQVWTDPIRVAELFVKKFISLDLFGVDFAAASSWQKGESEVIFVSNRRVKLDASDFPGLHVTVPDVKLGGKSCKVGIDLELVEVLIEISERRLNLLVIVRLDEQVNELLYTVNEYQKLSENGKTATSCCLKFFFSLVRELHILCIAVASAKATHLGPICRVSKSRISSNIIIIKTV